MKAMLENLSHIAREAGAEIMRVKNRGYEINRKDDESPVTEADLASNKIITHRLAEMYPDIPILSEEGSKIPYEERSAWTEFFLVDPLDGTKEFIKDNGEFCVCIALMQKNRPVLGIVYAPVQDTLYAGSEEDGAFVSRKSEVPARIKTSRPEQGCGLIVVGSRSHPSPDLGAYLAEMNVEKMVPAGSAIKFCMVAEGKAHMYPRFNPTMEWDTAAGQAIVEAAGGSMTAMDGSEFTYNKKNLRNGGFLVKA
ncbi:3'(2'),5'-bisphosphate nucleotidase CysQ [Maridesulfovibrio sp.]|uniref:3'(2'),5'-bisphosphate nucleotidase CysQ n=1 Tax=Maridesulfovibrio sp. TaxID=2795000 RepID=UPI002A18B688|nr:3'(2'),5'-bisphosphate nucleotidase CysQ [Maridesulfovibrio sp.]